MVGESLFWKLHYHLGHIDLGGIKLLCDLANYKINLDDARGWLQSCKCARNDTYPQLPLVGKHISNEPGETVMIDITFLEGKDTNACPVLITVCPLTRYVMCKFVKNVNDIALVSVFIVNWISVFSYPKLALCDQ